MEIPFWQKSRCSCPI